MNTVAEITKNIINADQAHLEALRSDTLNLRAYAQLIHNKVEIHAKKRVKIGTIVVTLSRIKDNLQNIPNLIPDVVIESLSIKSSLSVITFEKTTALLKILSTFTIHHHEEKDILVISEGITEITIVSSHENIDAIEEKTKTMYKTRFNEAIAVTIRFDEKYVEIPNVLYSFTSSLAVKRVNLLQIVSNLTEVSFIINKMYLNDTLDVFKSFLNT